MNDISVANTDTNTDTEARASARVVAVQDNILSIERCDGGGAFTKNEVVYIAPAASPGARLQAEILRVRGATADVQVYEDTHGVAVGDPCYQTGELLSVALGPGLLGQVYDGLQNSLDRLAVSHGRFLPRGVAVAALDPQKQWNFSAELRIGDTVHAADVIGVVPEGRIQHRIMAPFDLREPHRVAWIQEGSFNVDTVVARIVPAREEHAGKEIALTLQQRWPVRVPLAAKLAQKGRVERRYPDQPLVTTLRLIDTFFPVARGGTACIPGPFGAGKTVLQQLIARYCDVDVVVVVACGERAGEVVEIIEDFPRLRDPRGGGSLMDRTCIVCNTSSMPVAAREASFYTGITIGEYYRQMGLDVLLIADSTSRWAQSLRETSGRLEEIPGEEAFPAYLESSVRNIYERAGVYTSSNGDSGSLTIIGTVSPAGGNFEEPVTQATLNTVKAFLGLSAERAYRRYYPAIDPAISWSRYRDQLSPWFNQQLDAAWVHDVKRMMALLREGAEIQQIMQVTGEEGISAADFVRLQKALLVDLTYLQQDAFDDVDVSNSLERQRHAFKRLLQIVDHSYGFADKNAAREFFVQLTALLKNLNYSRENSEEFRRLEQEIEAHVSQARQPASP